MPFIGFEGRNILIYFTDVFQPLGITASFNTPYNPTDQKGFIFESSSENSTVIVSYIEGGLAQDLRTTYTNFDLYITLWI